MTGTAEPAVAVSVGSLTPSAAGSTKVVKVVASDPGAFTASIGSQSGSCEITWNGFETKSQ